MSGSGLRKIGFALLLLLQLGAATGWLGGL